MQRCEKYHLIEGFWLRFAALSTILIEKIKR